MYNISKEKSTNLSLKIGDRCKLIEIGRIGTVKYVGLIPEINKGYWLGIQLDDPVGKTNGR